MFGMSFLYNISNLMEFGKERNEAFMISWFWWATVFDSQPYQTHLNVSSQ